MSKRTYEQDDTSSSEEDASIDHKLPRGAAANSALDVPPEALMTCSAPPTCHFKPRTFYTIASLERHLAKHATRCPVCHLPFPSAHYQALHIEEHHDPVFEARRARGDAVFRCLVEVCQELFPSVSKRRRHLVSEHAYPETFRFNITTKGLNPGTPSLLYPEKEKRHPAEQKVRAKANQQHSEKEMSNADIETIPKQTRSQRRAARAALNAVVEPTATQEQARAIQDLFAGSAQSEDQEDVAMQDLTTSLASATLLVPRKIQFGRR